MRTKILINNKKLADASNSADYMEAKKFKNWTEEDFTWKWDGVPYTFKAGFEIFLEDYKAEHFAKHLVDREMNRQKIVTNRDDLRKPMLEKCFPYSEPVTPEIALDINEKVKRGKKVEPEFEELQVVPKKSK